MLSYGIRLGPEQIPVERCAQIASSRAESPGISLPFAGRRLLSGWETIPSLLGAEIGRYDTRGTARSGVIWEMSAQVVAVMPVQTETKLVVLMPEPKLRPSQVAVEALDALDSRLEEVFPGESLPRSRHSVSRLIRLPCRRCSPQRVHPVA
jgi:hypothetical protein